MAVAAGVTVKVSLFPMTVPPHALLYHAHVEPSVPNVPVTINVVDNPWHIVAGDDVTDDATAELSFTVTVLLKQSVV